MFLQKYINIIKQEPMVFFVGMSILSLAVMGTSVRHVSSAVFSILVLLGLSVVKSWREIFIDLSKVEKTFLIAFVLYTAVGILSFYNVDDADKYFKLFERYFRFALIIPVYLFILKKNVSVLNYLYLGAVVSGPFLFVIALHHYITFPDVPAQGYYHHIIFSQLAMLNVGIMLSLLLTQSLNRKTQLIIIASMLCGLATVVMSQARGVWLVFPVYVAVAVFYAVGDKRISKKNIAIFLAVIVLISMFTSIGGVIKQRVDSAISEVTRFYSEDQYISSVGTRLAMWDIAIDVWKKYPVLGTGPGDFDDEIIVLQNEGKYSGMNVHNSTHNIYIQALVGSGVVGVIALVLVLLVVPLRLFFDRGFLEQDGSLAGFIIVISFAIYGLSESWTLRLPVISVFLVYVVVVAAHMRIQNEYAKT